MPELPEVETIRQGLQKKIVGLSIKNIDLRSPKSLLGEIEIIQNKRIIETFRRAKLLGIVFENDMVLLFHLKLTGQLILVKSSTPIQSGSKLKVKSYDDDQERVIGGHPTPDMRGEMPNKHTRIIFEFNDASKLYFNDQRRFGWAKIVKNSNLKVESSIKNLGPEPLEKDFNAEILKNNLLRHKSMPVKVALMDQSVVSGVGNIYSNEACFDAGIDPRTKVADLSDTQFEKLYEGLIKSLKTAIKYGGSSRAHFVNADGKKGYFLDYANVYGKNGQECNKCKTIIKKIILNGRGTYYCEKCQK